jgi:hypothetical protein
LAHPWSWYLGIRHYRWGIARLKDLDALIEIVKLALLSAYVSNFSKPVSLLIIARPESGKTEVMKKFAVNSNIAYLSDATAYGIQRDYQNAMESGEIRHIMIPDLLKPLSRKESTVNTFITFMNSLIEDGIFAVSTYATIRPPHVKPVKCGLIAAITTDEFNDHRHKWERLGFLSRTIPFSYSYGIPTVNKVFQYIIGLNFLDEQDIRLAIPKEDKEIRLPSKYAQEILPSTTTIARAQETYGFRLQKQFQGLLQASALDSRRRIVNSNDVQRVLRLMDWVNFNEKPIAGGS